MFNIYTHKQIKKIQQYKDDLTLVFGATNRDDDLVRFGKGYVVISTEKMDPNGELFLQVDFNNEEIFSILSDNNNELSLCNKFNKLIIDFSTNKFAHWSISMLNMFCKLLKDDGVMYIDATFGVYGCAFNLLNAQKTIKEYKLRNKLIFHGLYLYKYKNGKLTEDEYGTDTIKSHNMELLKKTNFNRVYLVDNKEREYPINPGSRYKTNIPYYVAIKL